MTSMRGNGKLDSFNDSCAAGVPCPVPAELRKLTTKALIAEREVTNVAASLRETADRFRSHVAQLGEQLAHLGALVEVVAEQGALLKRIAVKVGVDTEAPEPAPKRGRRRS